MPNEVTRGMTPEEEERFREVGARFVRSTDPREQDELKAELVRAILRGQQCRQQHAIRELANLRWTGHDRAGSRGCAVHE